MNVWIEGMSVKVFSSALDKSQSQLRHIEGGRYDSKKKCWTFPLDQYDELVEIRNCQHGQISLKPVQINSSALKSMEVYLLEAGYSPSTIRNYRRHLALFLKYAVGNTDDETIQRYLLYLQAEKGCSKSYYRWAEKVIHLHLKLLEGESAIKTIG